MGGFKKALKSIKNWHLILIFIPLFFIAATLLRFDHLEMLDLRNAVLAADQAEDDAKIIESLNQLKDFASTHTIVNFVEENGVQHITFGTGGFYLERLYQRQASLALAEAEKKAAAVSDDNPNGNIFAKAMAVCKPQAIANNWTWNSPKYLNCFTTELAKYPTTDSLTTTLTADLPSTALYRYDFASPIWAPTPAGFVTLLCFIILLWIIIRCLIWIFLRIATIFLK